MTDSIDSFPAKISITDTNEHVVQIHSSLLTEIGDYLYIDVVSGSVDFSVASRAITGGNGRYTSTSNNRVVLKKNSGSFRYKATSASAEIEICG